MYELVEKFTCFFTPKHIYLNKKSLEFFSKGDYQNALGCINKAIEVTKGFITLDPIFPILYQNKAIYSAGVGELLDAKEACEIALEGGLGNVATYRIIANIYLDLGMFDNSKLYLEKLIKEKDYKVANLYAICLLHLGDYERSLEEFDALLALARNNYEKSTTLINKSILFFYQEDYQKALKSCQEALAFKLTESEAHLVAKLRMILIYLVQLNEGEAKQLFQEVESSYAGQFTVHLKILYLTVSYLINYYVYNNRIYADSHMNEIKGLIRKSENIRQVITMLHTIAIIAFKHKDIQATKDFILMSMERKYDYGPVMSFVKKYQIIKINTGMYELPPLEPEIDPLIQEQASQINQLANNYEQLSSYADKLEEENTRLKGEAARLRDALLELCSSYEDLKTYYEDQNRGIDRLRKQVESLTARIAQLESEKEKLTLENINNQSVLYAMKQQLTRVVSELDENEKHAKLLKDKLEKLTKNKKTILTERDKTISTDDQKNARSRWADFWKGNSNANDEPKKEEDKASSLN